jgi:hypothetical protein
MKHQMSPLLEEGLNGASDEQAREILENLSKQDCGALKPPAMRTTNDPSRDPSHPANLMDSLQTGTR